MVCWLVKVRQWGKMPDPSGKKVALKNSDAPILWRIGAYDLDSGAYDFHVLTYASLQVWQITIPVQLYFFIEFNNWKLLALIRPCLWYPCDNREPLHSLCIDRWYSRFIPTERQGIFLSARRQKLIIAFPECLTVKLNVVLILFLWAVFTHD